MKDWKEAIEHIGFHRCHYEKQDHIHCIAFRKTLGRLDYSILIDKSVHMYIPQDSNTQLPKESTADADAASAGTADADPQLDSGAPVVKKQRLTAGGEGT